MMKRIAIGLTSAGLLLSSVVPAFGAVNVEVSGNGYRSDNTVTVNMECKQKVSQKTKTNANVDLNVSGNTGGNKVVGNTGSGADVDTGAVTNTVTVTVTGGDNTATVPPCCCGDEEGDVNIDVLDNGAKTDNIVNTTVDKKSKVKQKSKTRATVTGTVKGKTGKNKVKYNTGGNSTVTTNDVDNTVDVGVSGGSNTLE